MKKRISFSIVFLIINIVLFIIGYLIIKNQETYIVDENTHITQIKLFYYNYWKIITLLTNIPGYHFFVYLIAKIFQNIDTSFLRTIQFCISVITIFIFFNTNTFLSNLRNINTAQFIALPILFIYFYLIYVDVFSLLFLLLSLNLFFRKHYNWSLFIIAISILVRQPNIIWVCYILSIILLKNINSNSIISTALIKEKLHENKNQILIFLITVLLFLLFVKFNGGIAIGDKNNHVINKIRPANIYFCLSLFFIINLFDILINRWAIYSFVMKNKILILFIFIISLFLIFNTFVIDHKNNAQGGSHYFIRMKMLWFYKQKYFPRFLLFITAFISLIHLITLSIKNKMFTVFLIFSLMSIFPLWLVEQRYYIPFFTLYLLFRKLDYDSKANKILQKIGLVYNTLICIYLFTQIYDGAYFL